MRLIDIYKQTAGGIVYVTGGCIQTGEPFLQRAPVVKTYTMADGSPLVYPSAKDTCTATVELECTRTQAAAIEQLVSGTHIIFAGLKLGALLGYDAQDQGNFPPTSPIPCIITGAVEVGEKFAKSGIYFANIPVQLIVGVSGYPDTSGLTLPVIRSSVTLDGAADGLNGYRIGKRKWGAVQEVFFQRKQIYVTGADSLTIGYSCEELTGAAVSVTLWQNGTAAADSTETQDAFTVGPDPGTNDLVLEFLGAASRPLYIGLTVLRQNAG